MQMRMQSAVFACALLGCVFAQSQVDQSPDGSSGSIKFTTPDLNDEEAHSPWMPDMLKCDACRAVALQLFDKFNDFNNLNKHFKFNLPESEVLDVTDAVCMATSTWERYTFKEVDKVHRLSGPGLETMDSPGMMQGGGLWPGRLMDMCEQYMGNVGEMEIYNAYKKNPKSRKQFEDFMCRGAVHLDLCKKVEEDIAQRGKVEL